MEIPKRAFRLSKKLQRISKKLNRYQGETMEVNCQFPFSSFFYPAAMKGQIDCLGNVRLKTTSTLPALIKRLPIVFDSEIGSKGLSV